MALLDSDPTAKELFDNALNNPGSNASTKSDTPSDDVAVPRPSCIRRRRRRPRRKRVVHQRRDRCPVAARDVDRLGHVAAPDQTTCSHCSSVWTGAPQGTPWNIPTAAIQNAAHKFVSPSEAAAAASEADATMDPTTNLVTFAPNANNTTAYNNYMMVESYLVVPTSGLSAAKASKLAQYIRFVVGPVAQSDETTLGSAPPTPSMVAADLKVATQLDGEAATSGSTSSTVPRAEPRRRSRQPRRLRPRWWRRRQADHGPTSAVEDWKLRERHAASPPPARTGIVPLLVVGAALVGLGACRATAIAAIATARGGPADNHRAAAGCRQRHNGISGRRPLGRAAVEPGGHRMSARGSVPTRCSNGFRCPWKPARSPRLIGPSGCGKSTFLRILNRMHELVPTAALSGSISSGRCRTSTGRRCG